MSVADPIPTLQQYQALEASSELKHEFYNGEIVAMGGGTLAHALISSNLAIAIGAKVVDGPCRVYSSDARLVVEASGAHCYPDLTVVCGDVVTASGDPLSLTNPAVLIEVLSPSTEAHDRGSKFAHYRMIPTLRAVVLVSQHEPRVEVFTAQEDGTWVLTEHVKGDVHLPIEVTFSVHEVYAGVTFSN